MFLTTNILFQAYENLFKKGQLGKNSFYAAVASTNRRGYNFPNCQRVSEAAADNIWKQVCTGT